MIIMIIIIPILFEQQGIRMNMLVGYWFMKP